MSCKQADKLQNLAVFIPHLRRPKKCEDSGHLCIAQSTVSEETKPCD